MKAPRRPAPALRTGLSALAGLMLAGCAVMTVDVDVYKGPLANHPRVQAEQLVTLAIGAKPLLVQLRDRLEGGVPVFWVWQGEQGAERLALTKLSRDTAAAFAANSNAYAAAYIPPHLYRFTNELAAKVNGVLQLYEDQAGEDFAELFRQGSKALAQYSAAHAVFRPANPAGDLALWRTIQGGLKPEVRDALRTKAKPGSSAETQPVRLARAYAHLLTESRRPETEVFEALGVAPGGGATAVVPEGGAPATGNNANSRFERLADLEFVNRHAALLFADPSGAESRLFTERTTAIANAFLEARKWTHAFMRLALRAVVTAQLADLEPTRRRELTEGLAGLAVSTIRPERLWEAWTNHPPPEVEAQLLIAELGAASAAPSPERTVRMANILSRALVDRPQSLALAILDVDQRITTNSGDPTKWRFGVARGPTAEAQELLPAMLLNQLYAAARVGSTGFEGGRLMIGLETMIESYLEASQSPLADPAEKEMTTAQLLDALVGFAQKTLLLSNFGTLLNQEKGQFTQYAMVLQAVGNSILIQVDELRQRQSHQERQRDRFEGERAAILASGLLTNAVATNALASLAPTSSAQDARQQLIASLRYEHAAALARGEARATNLAAAIEAATEISNDEVYLRPAAAYLRNSTPSTTLQAKSSAVGWENMLSQHAWRQVPFLNMAPTLLPGGGKHETLKIQRDLDKQYWQSINRVRVAGSGDANYVLVKDDIGNWYLKSYSANAEAIYRSMAGMAKFAYPGAAAGTIPATMPGSAQPATATETGPPVPGALDTKVKESAGRATDRFAQRQTEVRIAFTNALAQAREDLAGRWRVLLSSDSAGVLAKLQDAEARAYTNHLQSALKDSTPLPEALAALKRYYHQTAGQIAALRAAQPPVSVPDKAVGDLAAVTRPLMEEFVRRQRELLREEIVTWQTLSGLE